MWGVRMVVKSATKKRLMEMGIAEEYAHKLATDRNMNDIKSMTADEIASTLGVSKDDQTFTDAMNALAELGNRRQKKRGKKITISKTAIAEVEDNDLAGEKFNVLNHVIVPHQELIAIEDEESELEPWGLLQKDHETGEMRLAKELLPKILISDPVIQVIKETHEKKMEANADSEDYVPLPAGWISDRVLKVIRKSPSAGKSVAYRLIVEGS